MLHLDDRMPEVGSLLGPYRGGLPEAPARWLRQALADEQVVGLPTETVYGLAARTDRPAALDALRALKGRSDEQPFARAVGTLDEFRRQAPAAPAGALQLARTCWPGPLTLVVPATTPAERAGFRMPRQEATLAVLAGLPFPVALTSANRSGEPEAPDAAAARAQFGPAVRLYLDGAPTAPPDGAGARPRPSTVVAAEAAGWRVLREGALRRREVAVQAVRRLLLVCTGNLCRSPMAELLLRARLAERPPPPEGWTAWEFLVLSAGTHAPAGLPMAESARAALAARGIEDPGHRARGVHDVFPASWDAVWVMTRDHRDYLRELWPALDGRLELLSPSGREIPDPIGQPDEVFEQVADELDRALRERVPCL